MKRVRLGPIARDSRQSVAPARSLVGAILVIVTLLQGCAERSHEDQVRAVGKTVSFPTLPDDAPESRSTRPAYLPREARAAIRRVARIRKLKAIELPVATPEVIERPIGLVSISDGGGVTVQWQLAEHSIDPLEFKTVPGGAAASEVEPWQALLRICSKFGEESPRAELSRAPLGACYLEQAGIGVLLWKDKDQLLWLRAPQRRDVREVLLKVAEAPLVDVVADGE